MIHILLMSIEIMKKIIGILALIVVVLLVVFMTPEDKDDSKLKIGGLFGLTGFVSQIGEASQNGFIMAIEDSEIEVEYVIEDFQSDLSRTISAANKLVNIDKVDVVVGPEWNSFAQASIPVAESLETLFVSPWVTSEADWSKSDYFLSGTPSDRSFAKAMLEQILKDGHKTIIVMYTNEAWANEFNDHVNDEVSKNYSELKVLGNYSIAPQSLDMRTEILKIKQSNPDIVVSFMGDDTTNITAIKQLSELGIESEIYVADSNGSEALLNDDLAIHREGIFYTVPKVLSSAKEFNSKYKERFGNEPTTINAATSYDMTTLIIEAYKDGARSSEEIRDYILNVKNYEGYSGKISFNEDGLMDVQEVEIRQIKGDSFIIIN